MFRAVHAIRALGCLIPPSIHQGRRIGAGQEDSDRHKADTTADTQNRDGWRLLPAPRWMYVVCVWFHRKQVAVGQDSVFESPDLPNRKRGSGMAVRLRVVKTHIPD